MICGVWVDNINVVYPPILNFFMEYKSIGRVDMGAASIRILKLSFHREFPSLASVRMVFIELTWIP